MCYNQNQIWYTSNSYKSNYGSLLHTHAIRLFNKSNNKMKYKTSLAFQQWSNKSSNENHNTKATLFIGWNVYVALASIKCTVTNYTIRRLKNGSNNEILSTVDKGLQNISNTGFKFGLRDSATGPSYQLQGGVAIA